MVCNIGRRRRRSAPLGKIILTYIAYAVQRRRRERENIESRPREGEREGEREGGREGKRATKLREEDSSNGGGRQLNFRDRDVRRTEEEERGGGRGTGCSLIVASASIRGRGKRALNPTEGWNLAILAGYRKRRELSNS